MVILFDNYITYPNVDMSDVLYQSIYCGPRRFFVLKQLLVYQGPWTLPVHFVLEVAIKAVRVIISFSQNCFLGRFISLRGSIKWPAKSSELAPFNFFLHG